MKDISMSFRYIPVDAILLPKIEFIFTEVDSDKLKESINMNGFMIPIYVRPILQSNYEVLDGKKRVLVSKTLGITRVPCIVYDYINDAMAKEYRESLQSLNNNLDVNREQEVLTLMSCIQDCISNILTVYKKISNGLNNSRGNIELIRNISNAVQLSLITVAHDVRLLDNNTKLLLTVNKSQNHITNLTNRINSNDAQFCEILECFNGLYDCLNKSLLLINNIKLYNNGKNPV